MGRVAELDEKLKALLGPAAHEAFMATVKALDSQINDLLEDNRKLQGMLNRAVQGLPPCKDCEKIKGVDVTI